MAQTKSTTAFVFAGGGSLGAVQVGMLREVVRAGVTADLLVGSSVGALNAAYFASYPNAAGITKLEAIWRALHRRDVFPIGFSSFFRFVHNRDFLVDPSRLRTLVEQHIAYRRLEDAPLPVHVVATNLSGMTTRLSSGPVVDAVLASAAIPVAFPPVLYESEYLIDAAVASNTPILTAGELGATRLIVFPTGYACDLSGPPKGAIGSGLHALTLLIAHQIVRDLRALEGKAEVITVPPLCPLDVSPYDFSKSAELIERAAKSTGQWIEKGGLGRQEIPQAMLPHAH